MRQAERLIAEARWAVRNLRARGWRAGIAVGLLAVALAGIYGLIAFLVAKRTREIGIRIALGADGRAVRRLVLGSALRLTGGGAALGIGATFAASRWAESQLYGISATDPVTIAAVTVAVAAAALLATWFPARQAARVDPTVLLRN